jgi:hypothetical protein
MAPVSKSSSTRVASSSFFGFSLTSSSSSSLDSSSSSSKNSTSNASSFNRKDHIGLPSIVTIADSSSNNNPQNNNNNTADYKAKNALAKMQGSLAALLSFLSHHGLSPASVQELENALVYNNAQQYLNVMKRMEEYFLLLIFGSSIVSDSESEAAIFLLLSSWQALCHHVSLLHRQAHRDFTRLQGQPRRWHSTAPYHQHQRQQPSDGGAYTTSSSSSTSMQFSMSHRELVRTSLIRLTNLAEHSCDCQKGYLLAQRQWKRKVSN